MLSVINLFLDTDILLTWRKASLIVAKAQGIGLNRAYNIHRWIIEFVNEEKLPLHSYCYKRPIVLEDKDVAQEIQERLTEKAKSGFLKTEDVCDIIASDAIQGIFAQLGVDKPRILVSIAKCWLAKLNWKFGKKMNGMYIDGHK